MKNVNSIYPDDFSKQDAIADCTLSTQLTPGTVHHLGTWYYDANILPSMKLQG